MCKAEAMRNCMVATAGTTVERAMKPAAIGREGVTACPPPDGWSLGGRSDVADRQLQSKSRRTVGQAPRVLARLPQAAIEDFLPD